MVLLLCSSHPPDRHPASHERDGKGKEAQEEKLEENRQSTGGETQIAATRPRAPEAD